MMEVKSWTFLDRCSLQVDVLRMNVYTVYRASFLYITF